MPSVSAKQHQLMEAVAHGWKPTQMKGPPVSVAKEFVAADKGKKKRAPAARVYPHLDKSGE